MGDGTQVSTCVLWQEGLQRALIEAGTNGLAQREIIKKLENVALAEEIIPELEYLLACDPPKVQKFIVKTKGRPKTVWRATTHILKD